MMNRFILTILTVLCLGTIQAQDSLQVTKDSLTFSYVDLKDIYNSARKGYYLEKNDSLSKLDIISLNAEIFSCNKKVTDLETIIDFDTKLIAGLNRTIKEEKNINKKLNNDNIALKTDNKRLKREKKESIITGGAIAAFLIILNIAQ